MKDSDENKVEESISPESQEIVRKFLMEWKTKLMFQYPESRRVSRRPPDIEILINAIHDKLKE